MSRSGGWFPGLVVAFFVGLMILMTYAVVMDVTESRGIPWMRGGGKVAVVELTGVIYDPARTVAALRRYREDESIKAVVVRINSPGGGVAASHEIYEGVRRVRESGKSVVTSMGSVAASGGYYVACASDSILANPGTITGSIGVIIELTTSVELLRMVGLDVETIKSGPFKDAGSPHRELRPEERAYFQGVIDNTFEQFVEIVARGRNMDLPAVRAIADGRVFTGQQALDLGLVDGLGDYEAAVDLARRMAGLDDDAPVVRARRGRFGLLDVVFGNVDRVAAHLTPWPAVEYRLR